MIGDLAAFAEVGPGRFRGAFDASWNQGPGAYGGLVAAALGVAAERVAPGRPLRALSLHLCAPAEPGPLDAIAGVERQGTALTFVSARMEREGKAVALATATLGAPRVSDADFDVVTFPAMGAPELLPEMTGPEPGEVAGVRRHPPVPAFTEHFEFRFARGVPFSGERDAVTEGWLRCREPEPLSTALALALLDCWPLAVLPTLARLRPVTSVAIHFQLARPFPVETPGGGGWYRCRNESDLTRDGYSHQRNAVWDADGRLVGTGHQLVALLR
ncbi:MAG: thioesterase family protein [Alphaproteobacteria bacterium]|nr:thioesterase family protein [Alphaproteobacteria bacterium]